MELLEATFAGALQSRIIKTPLGRIGLLAEQGTLTSLEIEPGLSLLSAGVRAKIPDSEEWTLNAGKQLTNDQVLDLAASQIESYFDGKLKEFQIPLSMRGTAFQVKVWRALNHVRFGQAISYGELASTVGMPAAARAIGGAVGANPIAIIVGCHRVLAGNGALTGYSGGAGTSTKQWLLNHEGISWRA